MNKIYHALAIKATIFIFFLTLIISNFFINIFIFLSSFFFFKNFKFSRFYQNKTLILLATFFLYIFFCGFLYDPINTKNFTILRFFFLIFLIYELKKILFFETHLQKISLFFLIFISIDLLFQYFTGRDFFGFPRQEVLTGPFRDEIAGAFLAKLWIFSGLYIFTSKSYKINLLALILCFFGILLSSERMSLFFFISISVIFIFLFLFKKNLLSHKIFVIFILVIFSIIILTNDLIKVNILGKTLNQIGLKEFSYRIIKNSKPVTSYDNSIKITDDNLLLLINNLKKQYNFKYNQEIEYAYYVWGFENPLLSSPHNKLFNSAKEIFKNNYWIGTGVKSFQSQCEKNIKIQEDPTNYQCSSHPHNIHIQILQESGLIGYSLFLLIIINVIFYSYKNYVINRDQYHLGYLIGIILFLLPLPSGSFYGTFPASFFWFLIALNIYDRKLLIKKF